jgi:zinc and cadmium transporter
MYAIGATVGVSLLSLVGVIFFVINASLIKRVMFYLISFSTGAILGDVFMHMLPEMAGAGNDFAQSMLVVLIGILFSFAMEKIIHWRHCHVLEDHDHDGHHHPVGIISLFGEAIHNFIDGVVIAASFIASPAIGFSTTLAVVFHEIPQEIGDFAVLLHSGFSRGRALFFNLLSALTAVLGAVITLLLTSATQHLTTYMLPFAAGNLLYIAAADLIPELHKETGLKQGVWQIIAMIVGMASMYAILLLE